MMNVDTDSMTLSTPAKKSKGKETPQEKEAADIPPTSGKKKKPNVDDGGKEKSGKKRKPEGKEVNSKEAKRPKLSAPS